MNESMEEKRKTWKRADERGRTSRECFLCCSLFEISMIMVKKCILPMLLFKVIIQAQPHSVTTFYDSFRPSKTVRFHKEKKR